MKFRRKLTVSVYALILAIFGGYLLSIFCAFHKDAIWWFQVQRQTSGEEVRKWGTTVLQLYNTNWTAVQCEDVLTNAPASLTNNYRRLPSVFFAETDVGHCFHLRYGGGMGDWGLTIGPPQMTGGWSRGRHVEKWAPGVYFWSN